MPTVVSTRLGMRLVLGQRTGQNVVVQEQAVAEQLPAQPVRPRGRPKRLQGAPRLRVLTLRVPEELVRRLDAYTGEVQRAQPYLRLSRTDVLRLLLDRALPTASS